VAGWIWVRAVARLSSRFLAPLAFGVLLVACQGRAIPTPTSVFAQPVGATATPQAVMRSPTRAAPTPAFTSTPAATAPRDATSPTAIPTAEIDPATGLRDLARGATASASGGAESVNKAIDGDTESLWSAGGPPPQFYQVAFAKFYQVERIELVVAQTPDGQTTHEIWLGDQSGNLKLYKSLVNTWTADGQTIVVDVSPPQVTDRVMIRTTSGPSFVAWRQVRVFGKEPTAGASTSGVAASGQSEGVDWPQLQITGELDRPDAVTNAGDGSGRLFVLEQVGRVRVIQDGGLLKTPFLDVTDRVKCCKGEQGFLDVAFPPDFAKKGYFYASYISQSHGPVGDLVVARYHVTKNPNVADPKSEEIILIVPLPTEVHHSGHLAFGPKDGYLYVGVGDGGRQGDGRNVAQDKSSLLGKILRIDVESGVAPYNIPASNPFVRSANARGEIWALGLRNPWQFSFDSQTGDLYIADVGEDSYEEVDFQPADSAGGENYGWPIMEGKHCFGAASCNQLGLTEPVAEYDHTQGCAIIGGQVYRGARFDSMQGIYFYGDLCKGKIWGLKRGQDGWQTNLLYTEPFQITSIGADEQGDLYLTDYNEGEIMKIEAASSP
jgi:glucose/arabinose dehydrogenase